MTDATDKLDGAKERLQAEAPETPTRKQDPSYHVFKQTAAEGEFSHLTAAGAVKASSRKEAIRAAEKAMPTGEAVETLLPETFLVIAEKELQLLTRKVRTEVVEEFE